MKLPGGELVSIRVLFLKFTGHRVSAAGESETRAAAGPGARLEIYLRNFSFFVIAW